jgi:hypothetical protein
MADKIGVTEDKSLDPKTVVSPSDEGKSPSKTTDDRPELNRVMEENRKLKEQLESTQSEKEELEQLREERRLTLAEKQRLEKLNSKETDIESKIAEARNNPQNEIWFASIERAMKDASVDARLFMSESFKDEFVEDMAEKHNMKFEDLYNELQSHVPAKMLDQLPHKKVKTAYKNWIKANEVNDALKEAKALKDKEALSREDGTGKPRHSSFEDAAKAGDRNAMRKLAGVNG